MTATQSPAPLIEDLFCQGHPLDHIVTVGADVGWTKADVLDVLREREWDLDGSGRLPRSKRVTTPRGLRHLPETSMRAPAPPPRPPVVVEVEEPVLEVAEPIKEVDEDPVDEAAPAVTRRPGRQPVPIEHGTDRGYVQHKRKKEPIPADDSCGCQAAHDATLTRHRRPAATTVPDPAQLDVPVGDGITRPPHFPASPGVTVPPSGPTAEEVRAQVDAIESRVLEDGSINARFVAIESNLRSRHGHPSYIAELDGVGKFRPALEQAPETPTEGTAPGTIRADAAGTAPDSPEPGQGDAGPDAQPQVSPSRSHLSEDDGGLGASEAPAAPPVTGDQPPTGVDVRPWLTAAQRSTNRAVVRAAALAISLLVRIEMVPLSALADGHLAERLAAALDDVARAQAKAGGGSR